jgi:hypothetical protein
VAVVAVVEHRQQAVAAVVQELLLLNTHLQKPMVERSLRLQLIGFIHLHHQEHLHLQLD